MRFFQNHNRGHQDISLKLLTGLAMGTLTYCAEQKKQLNPLIVGIATFGYGIFRSLFIERKADHITNMAAYGLGICVGYLATKALITNLDFATPQPAHGFGPS